jgi:hypothetical protein
MSETRPFTAASFNQFLAEKKLMATRCTACNKLYLPPRAICPQCHGDQLEWAEMQGHATLIAFTSVYVGPTAMNAAGYSRENPYCTGIVQLDNGLAISAQILGVDARQPEQIKIGAPLTIEFIERGEGDKKKTYLAFKVG